MLARRVTKRGMKAMSDVNAAIKETISGISIAKNFRQEESIFKSFDESNQQSYQVNVQRGFVLSLVFPTLNALGGIFVAILIYVGGLSAAQGIVTVGAWYLFIMSLDQFFFREIRLEYFAGPVVSDQAYKNATRAQRGDIARNVPGAADIGFISLDGQHRRRCLRRDPRDFAIDEFIEHEVADAQDGLANHCTRQGFKIEHFDFCSVAGSPVAIGLIEKAPDVSANGIFKESKTAIVAGSL